MKKVISVLTTLIVALSFSGEALALSLEWTQTYTNPTIDSFYGGNPGNLALDSSGNVYVTGLYKSGGSTGFITRKYNSSGGLLWSQSYAFGTSGTQAGRGVAVHPSTGDVYVVGMAESNGYGHWRFVQYDQFGNFIRTWTYEQSFSRTEIPGYGLVIDTSGNIYSVAEDRSCPGNYCFTVVKFNSSGTFLDLWTSDDIGNLGVGNIEIDSSNNIYVFGDGVWYPTGSTPHSMIAIKYTNTGTKLQDYIFNKNQPAVNGYPSFGKVDSSGNVYIHGENRNTSPSEMDRGLVKFTNSGTYLWDITYSGWSSGNNWNDDKGFGLAIDSSGNIYSTGRSKDPDSPGSSHGTLNILFDSSGAYQDRNYYTSSTISRESDRGRDIIYHAASDSVYVVSDDNLRLRISKLGTATTCTGPLSFGNWTDHPTVTAGVTAVKSSHIAEMRTRINTLETDAGLSATSWTDPTLTGVTIKAQHINELRSAIFNIYTTCGQSAPSFTDGPFVTSTVTTVKAAHINELRSAIETAP